VAVGLPAGRASPRPPIDAARRIRLDADTVLP